MTNSDPPAMKADFFRVCAWCEYQIDEEGTKLRIKSVPTTGSETTHTICQFCYESNFSMI